jgi:maleylacetate reductase
VLPDADAREFSWEDGERLIVFGERPENDVLKLVEDRDLRPFVALVGTHGRLGMVTRRADQVLTVAPGPVPEIAAALRERVGGRAVVAIGGGRVIDSAKAIAGADSLRCAAVPTTLSGAEMTPFHRMPAGVDEWKLVRPELVVAIPSLMASQPMPDLAASAMNALAHAIEALYTPMATEGSDEAALRAALLIAHAFESEEPVRHELALGALLAGYASGIAGIAVHHAVCQTIVRTAHSPHAQTNAVMLAHFVEMMERRAPEAIESLAVALGDTDRAGAAERVRDLAARAGVTRLGELGVERSAIPAIVAQALQHPALANTPDPPGAEELTEVLEAAA